jgi:CheY-like chemotaxis protein
MHIAPPTAKQVVVVDDEPELLDLLRDIIEEEGYRVLPVNDPAKVESIARDVAPQLFLIDLMLPGTDGIELAGRLRSAGLADSPIVAMSASAAMLAAARASGLFQAALAKPFDLSTLLDVIGRYTPGAGELQAPA